MERVLMVGNSLGFLDMRRLGFLFFIFYFFYFIFTIFFITINTIILFN
jgi:hypothetical protein